MTRTTKYLLAIAIAGLIYLAGYYLHSFEGEDALGWGMMFMYFIGLLLGVVTGSILLIRNKGYSSLFYLTVCFFNISYLNTTRWYQGLKNDLFILILYLIPVYLGLVMFFLHLKELRSK
jgi:hypothetical protein